MSHEYESLPNINPLMKKSSITSSIFNASTLNNNKTINNNLNISSECDSIISERDDKNKEKKVFFEKVYKTKGHDSKSILSIAKDLNGNIQVIKSLFI